MEALTFLEPLPRAQLESEEMAIWMPETRAPL